MHRPHRLRRLATLFLLVAGVAAHAADGAAVREAGPYAVHYNAMPASEVDPELAQRHDLPRGPGHCIVTVAVIHRPSGESVDAMVMGEATRANGHMNPLDLREIRRQGQTYYIANLAVANTERVQFTLKVSPGGDMPPETIRFTRTFGAR